MRFAVYSLVIILLLGINFEAQAGFSKDLTKAVYLVKSGDHRLAIKFCNKVIEENPASSQAYYVRGFAYFQLEEYADAKNDFNKTIELEPQHADAYYYRGLSKRQLGKFWGAFQDLRRANNLNPSGTQSSLFVEVVKAVF